MAVVIDGTGGITTPGVDSTSLVLDGSSSGSITVRAPAVAGTNTITFPAGTGTVSVNGVSSNIVSGTAVASTSGTSIDFTGIPSWAKRITVIFNGVSLSGTSAPLIQIGAGSVVTSGYLNGYIWTGSNGNSTTGFQFTSTGSAATATYYGAASILLISTNSYVANGSFGRSDAAQAGAFGGAVALSGALDRVRITTVNGTDTFDAGTINILYE